jgi:uncharacterized protein (DUF1499 family)
VRPRILVLCVLALVLAGALALSLASRRRPPSGLVDGTLRACTATTPCVSSRISGGRHVEPIAARGDPHAAFGRLVGIVEGWPRTELLLLGEGYAHFEVVSAVLRLRSDFELHLDPATGRVDVRSGARVGTVDFGACRERVERLRRAYAGR